MKKIKKSKEPEKKEIRIIEINDKPPRELTSERLESRSWCGAFAVQDEIRKDFERVLGKPGERRES